MSNDLPGEDRPLGDDDFVDRRSGQQRRSGGDRRRGGRRHRRHAIEYERRGGKDRRKGQRRQLPDRRIFSDPRYKKARRKKAAPSVYSEADAAQVQHILSRIGHKPVCPVCEGTFSLGPVDKRGWEAVRQVACADCGRSTVVSNCVLARVMVVTRIEAVSQMLRTILTSVGHEVIEPPHTGAALDIYRENAADVVVMDTYALAEMAGQEFIRQLCNEFSDPRVLVLAARSSYRTADPSATAMQLGATLILRTPFSREELFQAVKEARA